MGNPLRTILDRCSMHGGSDFFIRSQKIGWNSKPNCQTIFAEMALTQTQLFEQGLKLVIEALRNIEKRADFHADIQLLRRIQQLKEPAKVQVSPASPESQRTTTISEPREKVEFDAPRRSPGDREQLEKMRLAIATCAKCPHLAASRHTVVFGTGNPEADLMFVGEAPGADEDMQGEPFVGRAGELLTKIIHTMGFRRSDVFIANVLKCRPDMPAGAPGNRPPTPEEMATCLPYLQRQIELIRPKVMVALGSVAMRGLFGKTEPMRLMRGKWHTFGSIPVMATYHPSYLLRNQAMSEKRRVWEDMLLVLERLEIPVSEKQRNYFLTR
jgi:uracil-DNA glycosylase family 4